MAQTYRKSGYDAHSNSHTSDVFVLRMVAMYTQTAKPTHSKKSGHELIGLEATPRFSLFGQQEMLQPCGWHSEHATTLKLITGAVMRSQPGCHWPDTELFEYQPDFNEGKGALRPGEAGGSLDKSYGLGLPTLTPSKQHGVVG